MAYTFLRDKMATMYRPKILFLHYIPIHNPVKFKRYQDGLATSLRTLAVEYEIHWLNLALGFWVNPAEFDLILVHSNWHWIPDLYVRKQLRDVQVPKALLVGGVATPPALEEMLVYDLLFYETEWYRPQIQHHPNIIHAFGIDTDIMKPHRNVPKYYDYMTVGGVYGFKRQWMLLNKPGKKLLVGEWQFSRYCIELLIKMVFLGIDIRPYTSYEQLAQYYRMSRITYIPAPVYGGGERAVLESRACGTPVEIESDNPKLKQILEGPIWDHHYYTKQLRSGIEQLLSRTGDLKQRSAG